MKPWLWLPPSLAHSLSGVILQTYGRLNRPNIPQWKPLEWRGIHFPNRLGIAGGADKNADYINGFWALGCGFIEVGTITPRPQTPNPGKILDRDGHKKALWNKLGFPSKGLFHAVEKLKNISTKHSPLLINIGKNRDTPNELAHHDYTECLLQLATFADAFVINISSPNTTGLRQIQKSDYLDQFLDLTLTPYRKQNKAPIRPVLLKLSPDVSESDLAETIKISIKHKIDGWVLGNTTTTRPSGISFPSEGGLSGQPLATLSKLQLNQVTNILGAERKNYLIISVGGVLTPEDVAERFAMGADLVEVYSAMVFDGPYFFKKTARFFSN